MMDFKEISEIITDKKSRYEGFLNILKQLFTNYHRSPEGRKVLYRVTLYKYRRK